jgi:tetratricopeptide (TPR) repeat protein
MKRPARASTAFVVAACAALYASSAPAQQQPTFVKVIPPGKEALIADMLGEGATLPDGCAFDGAALDRTVVVATYKCRDEKGARSVKVELHHPSDAAAGATATTAQFAIVPGTGASAALVAAIKARIVEREASFRWVSAEAPGLAEVPPAAREAPAPTDTPPRGLSPEESEQYLAGVKLYRDRKYPEALAAFIALGQRNPRGGVLGMTVAALASTMPDAAAVKRYVAEADARPTDTLAQFVAGVAAHYAGHQTARSRADKLALYQTTIQYLERARPAFEFEPRVFVYLAISNFRLGHQQEAQALIERAIPLSINDPDVYYCRAEILQSVDTRRAIEDIERYQAMIDKLHGQGVPVDAAKQARVKDMLAQLRKVAEGARTLPPGDELFDPVVPPTTGPAGTPTVGGPDPRGTPPPPGRAFASSSRFGALVVLVCLVGGIAWMLASRRRGGSDG